MKLAPHFFGVYDSTHQDRASAETSSLVGNPIASGTSQRREVDWVTLTSLLIGSGDPSYKYTFKIEAYVQQALSDDSYITIGGYHKWWYSSSSTYGGQY